MVLVAPPAFVRRNELTKVCADDTHAKDGINLLPADPESVYSEMRHDKWDEVELFRELPLGQGAVDFPRYLKALEEIGYKGFLTIERECGGNPVADIKLAADYLRKVIAEN